MWSCFPCLSPESASSVRPAEAGSCVSAAAAPHTPRSLETPLQAFVPPSKDEESADNSIYTILIRLPGPETPSARPSSVPSSKQPHSMKTSKMATSTTSIQLLAGDAATVASSCGYRSLPMARKEGGGGSGHSCTTTSSSLRSNLSGENNF